MNLTKDELDIEFNKHTNLAHYVIHRYFSHLYHSPNYEDYVQTLNLEIIRCLKRFDPSLGYAFTTFAIPNLIGTLQIINRDKNSLGVKFSRKITDAVSDIYKKYNVNDANCDILSYIDNEITDINIKQGVIAKLSEGIRLDELVNDDDNKTSIKDNIRDAIDIESEIINKDIINFVKSKLKSNSKIVDMILLGYRQTKIGEIHNVSQAQVSRIGFKIKELIICYYILSGEENKAKKLISILYDGKQGVDIESFKKQHYRYLVIPKKLESENAMMKNKNDSTLKSTIKKAIELRLNSTNMSEYDEWYINDEFKNLITILKANNLYSLDIHYYLYSLTENDLKLLFKSKLNKNNHNLAYDSIIANENISEIKNIENSNNEKQYNEEIDIDHVSIIDIIEMIKLNNQTYKFSL